LVLAAVLAVAGCCKEQEAVIEAHEAQIGQLEGENAQLEQALADCQADKEKMDDQLAMLEDARSKLDALSSDLEAAQAIIDEMKKKQMQAKKRLATLKDMLEQFKGLIEAGELSVKIENGKMVLELPSAVLFKPGRANLSKKGRITLSKVAEVLAGIADREFQVAGHTDDVPIKSSDYSSNWELSTARALSVVQFLQDEGVPPENLSAAGYGEYQPVAENDTKQGRRKNRRIEIVLMPNLEELPNLDELEKEL
jgi:chemotaxis protein MotB